jgi:hypothetical protein
VPTCSPSPGSVKKPIEYDGHPTPIPDKAYGIDWLGLTAVAMTLDVYADLFDSDFTAVAEKYLKLWANCRHEGAMG